MWFGPWFSGLRVTFPGPNPSTWLLREQISENDKVETQSFCGEMDIISEARAVFICSKIEGDGPEEAMIKVFMQYGEEFVPLFQERICIRVYISLIPFRVPCMGTEKLSADRRSQQRGSSESADFEAGGLRMVTRAKCSSTPKLLAVKKTTQPKAWWIPGGYLAFVAMTKVPGIKIERIEDLCSQEQEEMKQSFKKAWM